LEIPTPQIDKRLIFTVSSGRCGTLYLTELLKAVPGVASFHEPGPDYSSYLRRVQMDPLVAYSFWQHMKIPAIAAHPEAIYAETSHLFCKGFLEPALRMGLRPALVFLRRNPRQVAWSFFLRNAIPGRTTNGIQHLLDPRDLNVTPMIGWEKASNYQLCFWYALEMERRYLHYAAMAKEFGLATFDATSDELNDYGCFVRLLGALGLDAPPGLQEVHGAISGEKHNPNKIYHEMPGELIQEEESVWVSVEHFLPHLRSVVRMRYADSSL